MSAEKNYKAICKMVREYSMKAGDDFAEKVISNPHEWENSIFPFYENAASLLIDCLKSMDTKATAKTVVSAVNRILKNAPRDDFRGLVLYEGKYIACDSYRLVRLQNDIASLPHTESDFDVNSIMRNAHETESVIDLPTVVELKAYIAANTYGKGKYKSTKPYNIYGNVWVNPPFLIDMIQALPNCTAYLQNPNSWMSWIYFRTEDGDDGILCPVKPPENAKAA